MDIQLVDPGRQTPYYTRNLASSLAAAGHRVSLDTAPDFHYEAGVALGVQERLGFGQGLTSRPGAALAARSTAGRRLLRAVPYPWELGRVLRSAVRRRPDVVHWQWSLAPGIDAVAFRYLGRRGVPVVLTIHNVLPHRRRRWHAPAFRRLYRAAAAVVVHSMSTAERLRRLTGPLPGVVARIAMPVAAPLRQEVGAAREGLGLPAGAPVALFFGHVRPYKGLDLLLDAWPLVRSRVPAARLVVAGPGAEALGSGGADGLMVRPGYVPNGAVAALFGAADVVVVPYRDTYDSAVAATAFGYHRPVVATDVGGLGEALADGGGRVVPPGDVEALADEVAGLLADPEALAALAAEAAVVAKNRSWTHAVQEYRCVYVAARGRLAQLGPGSSTTVLPPGEA